MTKMFANFYWHDSQTTPSRDLLTSSENRALCLYFVEILEFYFATNCNGNAASDANVVSDLLLLSMRFFFSRVFSKMDGFKKIMFVEIFLHSEKKKWFDWKYFKVPPEFLVSVGLTSRRPVSLGGDRWLTDSPAGQFVQWKNKWKPFFTFQLSRLSFGYADLPQCSKRGCWRRKTFSKQRHFNCNYLKVFHIFIC